MDAFESLVATLFRHEGYWTVPNFKVELTPDDKRAISRASSPRWELDVVAYKGGTNEVLVVECKSYLDSRGVVFRNDSFGIPERYKLFTDEKLRKVVLHRLETQLVDLGLCRPSPTITLGLAIGKLAGGTKRTELAEHFQRNNWKLFLPNDLCRMMTSHVDSAYENDVAFMVLKLLGRDRKNDDDQCPKDE